MGRIAVEVCLSSPVEGKGALSKVAKRKTTLVVEKRRGERWIEKERIESGKRGKQGNDVTRQDKSRKWNRRSRRR